MLRPLLRTAIALGILAWVFPTVSISNWVTLLFASIVLTFLQGVVRPLLHILLIPINFVTLGFASTLLNVGLLWLATYLVPGFHIEPMFLFGVYVNEFFSLLLVSALIGTLISGIKLLL
jgi:putative membrane protein